MSAASGIATGGKWKRQFVQQPLDRHSGIFVKATTMTTTIPTSSWELVLEFGLAELQHFDPQAILTGDDAVDGFVLGLALAYNDLKSVQWMNFMLEKHKPTDASEISGSSGQWNGMRVGASRWIMALTHELLFAISRASRTEILKTAPIRRAIKHMLPSHKARWTELVKLADGRVPASGALRGYLKDVRNNGAFHFAYTEQLLAGYRANFVDDPKTPHNSRAYVSLGPTLKQTRFYFADAAALRMYAGDAGLQPLFEQSEALEEELHHTLQGFLFAYINSRLSASAALKPLVRPSGTTK